MPIVQDQLTPLRTSVTYEDLNNSTISTRILHNGSDFIKCEFFTRPTGPRIIYYRTNGDRAASYSMEEHYICDLSYDSENNKYYTLRLRQAEDNGGTYLYTLGLDEVDDQGQIVSNIVDHLDVLSENDLSYSDMYATLHSGIVGLTVSPDNDMAYVKVSGNVYNISITGTYSASPSGSYYDESDSGILLSEAVLSESGTYSFQYNETGDKFLQYVEYDNNTEEVRVRTLDITASGTVVESESELFLNIPDWSEYAGTDPYKLFLHGSDHRTLFYFRKHGTTQLNPKKTTGSNGVYTSNLFTSTTANFITSGVKKGDIIRLSGGSPALSPTIQYKTVVQVVDSNTLVLSTSIGSTTTSIAFEIATNADLLQFNADRSLSAFASVNVDDYSLRAGTSDSANVFAEVINAWGDPLEGKTVSFVVSNGDGAVDNPSTTTDINGVATTVYRAGITPGAVNITATISD